MMKEINDLRSQILQAQVDSVMKIKADTGISLPVMPMGPMMMGMGMHRMQMQGCHMMPMPPQGPQSMPMQKNNGGRAKREGGTLSLRLFVERTIFNLLHEIG
ncbi:MAG: hypothetical protein HWD59_07125 [Coxiellaceae bacterium]|nr:MAG: hypothetical protein HWD59_07125 [Coxiellaceae bacterium]